MIDGHPLPFMCPDPSIATGIQKLVDGQEGQSRTLKELVERVGTQNHRVEKLEHAAIRADERAIVNQEHQDRQTAGLRWVFMAGLGAAGLLSALVDRLLP